MSKNVFKFSMLYCDCEQFSETGGKLRAIQEQIVLLLTDFKQHLDVLVLKLREYCQRAGIQLP